MIGIVATKSCLSCNTQGAKNRCGGCKSVYFCDRECQKKSWGAHRPQCIAISSQVSTPEVQERIPDTHEESPPTDQTATRRNRRKHKKKRKGRSKSLPNAPNEALGGRLKDRSSSLHVDKHVMWGDISIREFNRFPGGGGAVPYDGTWALGLGEPLQDLQVGSVLDYEEHKNQELEHRIKLLPKKLRSSVHSLETRQFDYRKGANNPLFSRLDERERRQVFSEEETSPPSSPELHPLEMEEDHPDFACLSSEQQEEFARIRESREEGCGCSCGELVKRVGRMNVKKLHHFLESRGVEIDNHAKPQLLARAKAIAMDEQNCTNSDECACRQNGVECHASVCSGCGDNCENPLKAYSYHRSQVDQYRQRILTECNHVP